MAALCCHQAPGPTAPPSAGCDGYANGLPPELDVSRCQAFINICEISISPFHYAKRVRADYIRINNFYYGERTTGYSYFLHSGMKWTLENLLQMENAVRSLQVCVHSQGVRSRRCERICRCVCTCTHTHSSSYWSTPCSSLLLGHVLCSQRQAT